MIDLTQVQTGADHHGHEESMQLITFHVHEQEYGINIMEIREIKGWTQTTRLPNTPEYVMGVINLRGAVVPIIDLGFRFGLGYTDPSKSHVVMIVMVQNRIMGILVDAVSDILTVPLVDIKPLPSVDMNNKNGSKEVITGIIEVRERMVSILNLENVFDHSISIAELSEQVKKHVSSEEKKGAKASKKANADTEADAEDLVNLVAKDAERAHERDQPIV